MSLINPDTIRGRPTLKDVERFRNGSFHEFCRLKALILNFQKSEYIRRWKKEESSWEELWWWDKKQQANRRTLNSPVQQPDSFPFFMMMDTCNEQFDISYIMSLACVDTTEKSALKWVKLPSLKAIWKLMKIQYSSSKSRSFTDVCMVGGTNLNLNDDEFLNGVNLLFKRRFRHLYFLLTSLRG